MDGFLGRQYIKVRLNQHVRIPATHVSDAPYDFEKLQRRRNIFLQGLPGTTGGAQCSEFYTDLQLPCQPNQGLNIPEIRTRHMYGQDHIMGNGFEEGHRMNNLVKYSITPYTIVVLAHSFQTHGDPEDIQFA
jgi:hypothetical protein